MRLLSWNEIRSRIDQFVLEFEGESREHAEYATFWDQLLDCYGVTRRRVATFQQQATRASTGNTGFIDFFWPKVVIGEHKSLGKMGPEGELAEWQAFDYLAGGSILEQDFPRYIISTDFEHFRVTDLEADGGHPKSVYFPLTDLRKNAEQLGFLAGYQSVDLNTSEQEEASIKAAKVMADLYAALTGDADQDYDQPVEDEDEEDEQIHATAVLLTRLLFLMFGDDAALWDKNLFTRFIEERTAEDGTDLGAQLALLFRVLDTPENKRPAALDESFKKFPYVNGGIFDGSDDIGIIAFDRRMREALLRACRFEWSGISPAVFGSLFQAVKSKQARRLGGEHYTTETNIQKTINPLFLDDYRARVRAAWNNAKKLRAIQAELATNTYCDPACGCGNFLVIAYRELRSIELMIMTRLREIKGAEDEFALDVSIGQSVTLDQFTGIEINWWPAKIAETAMFLVDHQANVAMAKALGHAPDRLPITISANIVHDNALTTDWAEKIPKVTGQTYVFGNPPFLGHKTKKAQQRAELQHAWGSGKTISTLDYVTAWHAKSLAFYRGAGRKGEWAFVTTNSIAQGDQVPLLFGEIFDDGWRIKYAHRTFRWTSEAPNAAAVHCVIVGFTRDPKAKPRLFDYPSISSDPVETPTTRDLNGYLIPGPDVRVAKRSTPLSSEVAEANFGTMAVDGGNLLISADEFPSFEQDPVAAKYVRKFIGARELLHDTLRGCLWLESAGADEIRTSTLLRERVEECRDWRSKQPKSGDAYKLRQTPHLFRPNKSRPTTSYVCIPRHVSETRRYFTVARYEADVIAGDANFTMSDPDGLQFSIISSSMFIAWQKAIGGRIKSDLRFAQGLTWYTFPMPALDTMTRKKLIQAGQGVLDARALHPERSLSDHYSPLSMDPVLIAAHDKLDRAVDGVFGSKSIIREEAVRHDVLFEHYLDLTGGARLI